MTVAQSIILGALQGLTEFLPVSSSGHIVLGKAIMHINENIVAFEVFVRFGTILSVILVFLQPLRSLAGATADAFKEPAKLNMHFRNSENFRLAVFVILGCIPAAVSAILFNDRVEAIFDDPKLVADMLFITGAMLFFTRLAKPSADGPVTLGKSIVIGLFQMVAVIPGISRPAMTIGSGVLLGIAGEKAVEFSFLMAIPVIIGATILKAKHLITQPPMLHESGILAIGTVVACVTGYLALRFLILVVKRGKFSVFSYYCFIVGILGILFLE